MVTETLLLKLEAVDSTEVKFLHSKWSCGWAKPILAILVKGSGGILPQVKFRHSEINSGAF